MCTYAGEKIELSPTKLVSLGLGSLRARAVRESRAFFYYPTDKCTQKCEIVITMGRGWASENVRPTKASTARSAPLKRATACFFSEILSCSYFCRKKIMAFPRYEFITRLHNTSLE